MDFSKSLKTRAPVVTSFLLAYVMKYSVFYGMQKRSLSAIQPNANIGTILLHTVYI